MQKFFRSMIWVELMTDPFQNMQLGKTPKPHGQFHNMAEADFISLPGDGLLMKYCTMNTGMPI